MRRNIKTMPSIQNATTKGMIIIESIFKFLSGNIAKIAAILTKIKEIPEIEFF